MATTSSSPNYQRAFGELAVATSGGGGGAASSAMAAANPWASVATAGIGAVAGMSQNGPSTSAAAPQMGSDHIRDTSGWAMNFGTGAVSTSAQKTTSTGSKTAAMPSPDFPASALTPSSAGLVAETLPDWAIYAGAGVAVLFLVLMVSR